MRGSETPYPIAIKFCMVVDIPDVITFANFGEDRLRGLWVAGDQNLAFFIDFDRRPYNTPALPCECMISNKKCGPMPNVMAALPNIGGALCSTPQFG